MNQEALPALYESVAQDMSALITGGLLRPGARVPSVRVLSRQKRISVSTVLQAYSLLENRGLIEARPQSGYFVRRALPVYAEPAVSQPPRAAQMVGVQALVARVLDRAAAGDRKPGHEGARTAHPSARRHLTRRTGDRPAAAARCSVRADAERQ